MSADSIRRAAAVLLVILGGAALWWAGSGTQASASANDAMVATIAAAGSGGVIGQFLLAAQPVEKLAEVFIGVLLRVHVIHLRRVYLGAAVK